MLSAVAASKKGCACRYQIFRHLDVAGLASESGIRLAGYCRKSVFWASAAAESFRSKVGRCSNATVAVTGHKTLALVRRYTEAAGREGMADSAIEKLIARPNGERNLANLPKRFVKSDTKPKQGKDNL